MEYLGIDANEMEAGGMRPRQAAASRPPPPPPPGVAPNPAAGRAREEAEQGRRARAGLGRRRRLRGQFAGGCVRAAVLSFSLSTKDGINCDDWCDCQRRRIGMIGSKLG